MAVSLGGGYTRRFPRPELPGRGGVVDSIGIARAALGLMGESLGMIFNRALIVVLLSGSAGSALAVSVSVPKPLADARAAMSVVGSLGEPADSSVMTLLLSATSSAGFAGVSSLASAAGEASVPEVRTAIVNLIVEASTGADDARIGAAAGVAAIATPPLSESERLRVLAEGSSVLAWARANPDLSASVLAQLAAADSPAGIYASYDGSVNTAPVASPQSLAVAEDGLLHGVVSAVDAEGDSVTFEIVGAPAGEQWSFDQSSGAFDFVPPANFSGQTSFSFRAFDGRVWGPEAVVAIVVSEVNDLPTITAIADVSKPEDTSTGAIAFSIFDQETAAASLTLSATSSNPTLVPTANIAFGGSGASRTVTASPAANAFGTTTITVSVNDGQGGSASRAFVFSVSAVDDLPVVSVTCPTTAGIAETTAFSIGYSYTDVEGQAVTFYGKSGLAPGTTTATTMTFPASYSYVPSPTASATYNIAIGWKYTAGGDEIGSQTCSGVKINNVAKPPTLALDTPVWYYPNIHCSNKYVCYLMPYVYNAAHSGHCQYYYTSTEFAQSRTYTVSHSAGTQQTITARQEQSKTCRRSYSGINVDYSGSEVISSVDTSKVYLGISDATFNSYASNSYLNSCPGYLSNFQSRVDCSHQIRVCTPEGCTPWASNSLSTYSY